MPLVPLASLPDTARCWVFGADAPLDEVDAPRLLAAVDTFLFTWTAHGAPLTSGREFRDERFLVVAVDEAASEASGCSIDGLFHILHEIEEGIGASLLGGGTIYFRGIDGMVLSCSSADFELLATSGDVGPTTRVFDTTLTSLGAVRTGFERAAGESWHARLLPRR